MLRSSVLWAACLGLALVSGVVAQPPPADKPAQTNEAARAAEILEKAYAGARPPESVRMLNAILRGSQLGPGEGWFGPAQSRYTWDWLAKQCAVDPAKGAIP